MTWLRFKICLKRWENNMKSLVNSIGQPAILATLMLATAMAILILAAGCDMGTYENRLNEGRSDAAADNT